MAHVQLSPIIDPISFVALEPRPLEFCLGTRQALQAESELNKRPGLRAFAVEGLPKRSQYSNGRSFGHKWAPIYVLWAIIAYYLGTWTLRVRYRDLRMYKREEAIMTGVRVWGQAFLNLFWLVLPSSHSQ